MFEVAENLQAAADAVCWELWMHTDSDPAQPKNPFGAMMAKISVDALLGLNLKKDMSA